MNKTSGGDGIPVELFQILNDDAVEVMHSICQQIWEPQQWPQDWKMLVFIPIPKKGNDKECSNYSTIAVISHASKVMLKILQGRLQQYVSHELPNEQMDLEKAEGTEIKLLLDKYLSALLTTPKLLTVWITTNWKIFKGMAIEDHLTCL